MIYKKKYHQLKISILEMIEECDKRIDNEHKFMKRFNSYGLGKGNSLENIKRHENIKNYLKERYEK